MSKSALVIGGTRFIGCHTVEEFLANEYAVTIFNRGNHDNPFADDDRVEYVEGDRLTVTLDDDARVIDINETTS